MAEEGGGTVTYLRSDYVDPVRINLSPRRRSYRVMGSDLNGRRGSRLLPVPFERASRIWWDLKFDSEVLEGQHWRSCFPQAKQRFQWTLMIILITSMVWGIYFAVRMRTYWTLYVGGCSVMILAAAALFAFTHARCYLAYHNHVAIVTVFTLIALSLVAFSTISRDENRPASLTTLGLFSMAVQTLVIIYTVTPLPMYACILIGTMYSIVFETLTAVVSTGAEHSASSACLKILLHLAIHILGIHMLIMSQVRTRSTFLKVGLSMLVRRDLELEKQLKEKMIHSVMPPKVATWLMTEGPADEEEIEEEDGTVRKLSSPRASQQGTGGEIQSLFRPFNMNRMEDVSILFADIAGFTRMSSNKTAEQLVGLLNDLFGRFDQLCVRHGCEKISTLGDCYYCVSGCPEPRPDHARCCVEMGLSMIRAIKQFDEDTHEDVNMRVGVHTGTVLCGIVGTRRFKFDVWSNDVTFANRMESTGRPGRVHISETTYRFLNDEYYVEEGDTCNGLKTYFIIGSKNEVDGITSTESCWNPSNTNTLTENSQQMEEQVTADITLAGSEELETLSPMLESEMPKKSSLTQSWSTLNSRKDSGIRSRRSSIQAQLMESNIIGHRVSDYYTSSQSSVVEAGLAKSPESAHDFDSNVPLNESLTRFHQQRKQSDLQMIKCIQHDSTHVDYFMRPPISPFTLFFLDPEVEVEYRERAHRQDEMGAVPTLASSTFNTYFDILVAAIIYGITAFECFMLYTTKSLAWLVFFSLATFLQIFVILLCIHQLLSPNFISGCFFGLYTKCTQWYTWHFCGSVLICIPILSVYTNFSCDVLAIDSFHSNFFCYLLFITLVHFCNFIQLNCWIKSITASIGGLTFVILLTTGNICNARIDSDDYVDEISDMNITSESLFSENSSNRHEAILAILLLLLLIWYLNRDLEIGYRISFHGSLLAERDQEKIQMLKDQADWLLNNIIPKHVADCLKTNSKYSENHENVGVIFASIVNFNEMYDESFHGGRECLRVLNEVIGDFDELLHRPEFKNVEKIKTIGSTFMAASGLNSKVCNENIHPYQHLFELMDFALALQKVIKDFNSDLLGFNFIIRIGYNFGDVTAGVIGTTKLYYDIWGDAVNIASRMDSTGVPGKIQVPEHCLPILEEIFEFERRGTIYVKGKDHMNVHLLVNKKIGATYRSPRQSDAGTSHHSVQFSQ